MRDRQIDRQADIQAETSLVSTNGFVRRMRKRVMTSAATTRFPIPATRTTGSTGKNGQLCTPEQ